MRGRYSECRRRGDIIDKQEQFQLKKGEEFLDENYGGSLPSFVAAFASRKKLSKDDIAYLKKIIDESR